MHTVIIKDNNDVVVFGCNNYGQLGLGHNDSQHKPIRLMQNVAQLQGYIAILKWSSENHRHFSTTFRKRIYYFLLVHKRNQNNTGFENS